MPSPAVRKKSPRPRDGNGDSSEVVKRVREAAQALGEASLLRIQLPGRRGGFLLRMPVGGDIVRTPRVEFTRPVMRHSIPLLAQARRLAREVREIDEAWACESVTFKSVSGEVPLRLLTPYDEVEADYAHMAWGVASALARLLLD